MPKHSLSAILIVLVFLAPVVKAQYVFEGKLVDADSGEPVKYARLWIKGTGKKSDTLIYANSRGYFKYILNNKDNLSVLIEVENYHNLYVENDITGHDEPVTYIMYKLNSDSYWIEDIAEQDQLAFFLGFDFLTPATTSTDTKFKSGFVLDYGYEIKFKLASNTQLGFRYVPIRFKWMNMHTDTTLIPLPRIKDRYFEVSTSIGAFLRYIFTTNKSYGFRGFYTDLGINYTLPYYFGYIYYTEKNIKTSQNNIHRFNDIQAMLRLGYGAVSLRASYRFTNIIKNDFTEPPKLTLGIEFNIPM